MPTGKRVYNWYISLVAASCMVLYGYDNSTFNAISGSKHWDAYFNHIKSEKKNANLYAALNTAYYVGAIVAGWFFGGPLADWGGRRLGMATGAVLVIIATFMQTFGPRGQIGVFIGGRVLVGMGQGVALTAGPAYINELSPPEIRGKIMSFWQMFYSVGSFIAYWVGYACQKHKTTLGEWDWKMIVIFQLLVPVFIVSMIFTLPETPRWYIQRGNHIDKARDSLRRVRDSEEEVEMEITQIRDAIEFEKEAISSSYSALWKDPSVRRRLFIAFALNAGQQITGQGTLNTYSTIVYQKVFKSDDTIFLINALNATFAILFTLNATWTVERYGRKFLFIVGALGMGVCMILVATVYTQTPAMPGSKTKQLPDGVKSRPVGIAIAFIFFLFSFFYKPSWGATTWIWTSEVFSMNVRAQAVGMASQTQNIANIVCQQFFPLFLNNKGFYAFYMFAGVNFLLAVFVWFVVPETRNVSLEEMDVLFGGTNHVQQGDAMLGHKGSEEVKSVVGSKGAVEHVRKSD
ncbi:MFS sugar transporter-like protein [Tothia fuscella]|uniref:MFS sugar transporter-like protein n=1 Tax=Tothia fuscella TaxID=1048955 RepID=A0A9P4TXQ7_9PEZI|nr:MFS sugar transporter-like protein [Tothia fuscella]